MNRKFTLLLTLALFALFSFAVYTPSCVADDSVDTFKIKFKEIKTISVARGEFAYREVGDPTGFPVVMLHG